MTTDLEIGTNLALTMLPSYSPADNLLLYLATLILMTAMLGCGRTEQPAADDNEQVEPTEPVAAETRKIPRLDIKQLMQELPKSYPDDAYVELAAAGVRLVPPPGFTEADRFHGFVEAESDATVMVTMAPVSFPEISKQYILTLIKDPRLEALSSFSDSVEIDGQEAAYAYFVQETATGTSAKHLLALGDEKTSWFVTGVYPEERQDDFAKEVLKSMMSVRLIPGSVIAEPGSDVDFTLSAPSLKVTSGWTKAIVFTRDGIYPLTDPTNPCFKAAPSMEAVHVERSDQAKFALQQILPSPEIRVEHVFIDREISVDGLPGREMMALADDMSTNTPILLYAAVLFEENSYVTLHGWAGQYVDEDWGAEFKAITESFKRK